MQLFASKIIKVADKHVVFDLQYVCRTGVRLPSAPVLQGHISMVECFLDSEDTWVRFPLALPTTYCVICAYGTKAHLSDHEPA